MEIFCSVLGISSHFGNPSSISDFCDFLKIFGKSKPFMTISDLEMKRGQFTVGVANVIIISLLKMTICFPKLITQLKFTTTYMGNTMLYLQTDSDRAQNITIMLATLIPS